MMFRIAIIVATLASLFIPIQGSISAQSSDPAVVRGATGEELASIVIDEVLDPFELYDPGYPPIIGYHYLLMSLTVENRGTQPWMFDPSMLALRDQRGYLFGDVTIYRDEEKSPPDLDYQEIPTADSVSGAIGFQVLNGSELTEIFITPRTGQVVQVAGLGKQNSIELGGEIEIVGNEGGVIGTVAISSYEDPFEAFLEDSGPETGFHFVGVEISVENSSPRPLHLEPNHVFLQDSDGFLYEAQTVFRAEGGVPEFEYQDLESGSIVTGWIGYSVPDVVSVVRVLYQPAEDRLVILADVSGASSGSAWPGPADSVPDANSVEIDCDANSDWVAFFAGETRAVPELVDSLNEARDSDDPALANYARNTASLFLSVADDLHATNPPAALSDISTRLADAYETYGNALQDFADAVESGDESAIDEAGKSLNDAEDSLNTMLAVIDELVASCET